VEDDYKAVEAGMTKCSIFTGHDQAAGLNRPSLPEPDEVKADVEALEKFTDDLRKRRKQ
jgi:hypothetical protein